MLMAAQNRTLADIELRSVRSRNYPYVKLNGGYGYRTNHYGAGATLRRNQWGGDVGLTVGFNLYFLPSMGSCPHLLRVVEKAGMKVAMKVAKE